MFTVLLCQSLTQVNYIESDMIIPNPERGFSVYRSSQVTGGFINSIKQYNVTVIQRIYTIPQFNNSPLSADFLNMVESDLAAAREGGVKLILRFSYTDEQNGPDAPLNIIQQHIQQLKPIFQNNYDVIVYIEAGFIGAWGEWYYSTNNLNNTNDRRTVLFTLLDALPEERCVVVRTPDYKRKIFSDINPIDISEAFNGSKKSRTGAHNDCFLASATDFGTYLSNDIEGDKNYVNQDNMFVPQGGETCSPSAYSGCDNAQMDLARMHWSILNRDYNTDVLDTWKSEGCYDAIQKSLGYRFVLISGEITNTIKPGGEFNINLTLVNKGYASPFNSRNVELVLRNVDTKDRYRAIITEDPRFWFAGDSINIEVSAGILSNMLEGNYEVFLHLADPLKALHDRPEYSIQLANENVWEDSTGFNSLNHILQINNNATGNDYTGDLYFLPDTIKETEPTTITIDGEFNDWQSVPQLDLLPNTEETGDALNASTDIVDVWAIDDENKLYISYSLDSTFSEEYFYHIFFDTDSDTSTGFHSAGSYAGIDLMIENDQMWKYTGTNVEWSWTNYGTFSSAIEPNQTNRIELAIFKDLLSNLGTGNSIEILFNVNDNDENIADDYAPNLYKQMSYTYSYLVTSVKEKPNNIVKTYSINAFPNPFNNTVNFNFNVENKNIKSLSIYNILGQLVKSFQVNKLNTKNVIWNGNNNYGVSQSSGIYIIQLQTPDFLINKKIVLLK